MATDLEALCTPLDNESTQALVTLLAARRWTRPSEDQVEVRYLAVCDEGLPAVNLPVGPVKLGSDLIPATSDPAPGSVIASAPIFSPDTIGTRNRFFCSADPHSYNGSETKWLATKTVEQAAETRAISSMPITIERRSPPRPPYSSL